MNHETGNNIAGSYLMGGVKNWERCASVLMNVEVNCKTDVFKLVVGVFSNWSRYQKVSNNVG